MRNAKCEIEQAHMRVTGITLTATPLSFVQLQKMSIDINWDAFTTGPDGAALALQIRDFIHEKFQRIALPKFIQSVQVISFDFGSVAPDVEIRSIGDPYVEFYEDDDDEGGESDDNGEDDAEEEGEIGVEREEAGEEGVEEGVGLEWRSSGEGREGEEQRGKQEEPQKVRGGMSDGAIDRGNTSGDGNGAGSDGGIGCDDDGGGQLGGGLEREMRRFRRREREIQRAVAVAGEGKGMGSGEGAVGAGAGTGIGGREERKRPSGTASGVGTNDRITSPAPADPQIHTYPHSQPQYHHHHHHHHHSRTSQQQQKHHHNPSTATTQHRGPGLAGFRSASDSFRQGGVSTPLFPFSAPPTSNLHYFHSALSSAFNGGTASTIPLPLQSPPPLHHHHHHHHHYHHHLHHQQQHLGHDHYRHHHPRGSSPPSPSSPSGSSLSSLPSPSASPRLPPRHLPPTRSPTPPSPPPLRHRPRGSSDIQITARVRYAGDIRIELTTELLLDYPARSFVSLPVRLVVTGLSFDGVACVVWMGRRLHFCFLEEEGMEDVSANSTATGIPAPSSTPSTPGGGGTAVATAGQADVGSNGGGSNTGSSGAVATGARFAGGMLKEIKVESEIGERGKGKQVLKNVGKVERFVLDQVRRIFEEEFVFPSTWTFLV